MDLPVSAETLLEISASAALGLAVFDANDLHLTWCNTNFRKMVRMRLIPPEYPEVGLTIRDLVAASYRPILDKLIVVAGELPMAYDFERPFRRTRDTTFPAEFWLRRVQEKQGEKAYLVLEIVDMSLQKLFEEVTRKRAELHRILLSISDALLVVDGEFRILELCSETARKVFGRQDLAGIHLGDLLFPKRKDVLEEAKQWRKLETFLATAFSLLVVEQYPLTEETLAPQSIRIQGEGEDDYRQFSVSFSPVILNDSVNQMVLAFQDQTELSHLKQISASVEHLAAVRSLQNLAQLGPNRRDEFLRFIEESGAASALVEQACSNQVEVTHDLMRALHTIKGTVRLYDMVALETLAHASEEALTTALDPSCPDTTSAWRTFRKTAHEVFRTLDAIAFLLKPPKTSDESLDGYTWEQFIEARAEMFHRLANDVGKEVELQGEYEGSPPRRKDLGILSLVLLHLARNAIDHGIERRATRVSSGKAPIARLTCKVNLKNGMFSAFVSDDGRGIGCEAILSRARANDLISQTTQHLSNSELLEILCMPGFSSREEVTLFSGRGVGMSAVRKRLVQHGGTLTLLETSPEGTAFHASWRAQEDYGD